MFAVHALSPGKVALFRLAAASREPKKESQEFANRCDIVWIARRMSFGSRRRRPIPAHALTQVPISSDARRWAGRLYVHRHRRCRFATPARGLHWSISWVSCLRKGSVRTLGFRSSVRKRFRRMCRLLEGKPK
jgi:hypothetical protein